MVLQDRLTKENQDMSYRGYADTTDLRHLQTCDYPRGACDRCNAILREEKFLESVGNLVAYGQKWSVTRA